MMSQPEPNSHIELPDGRTLSYMQAGADAGPVVTVLDGPCSRGLGRALAPTARELGIRLLIPDRPGIHGSAAKPGRTMVTGQPTSSHCSTHSASSVPGS